MKIKAMILLSLLTVTKILQAQEQPNVLWILTDDQRYDSVKTFNKILHGREMSELGYIESPNVDRLASMGTTFINTYCQAMGCAPSRASMHLGRYPFRSGVYQFEYHNNKAEHMEPSLPEQMADLGYQTMHVGKLGFRLKTLKNGNAVGHKVYQTDINFRDLARDGLTDWGHGWFKAIKGVPLNSKVEFCVNEKGEPTFFGEQIEEKNKKFKGNAKKVMKKYDVLRHYNSKKPKSPYKGGIIAGVSPQPAGKTRDGYYQHFLGEYLDNANQDFKAGSKTFKGVDPSKPLFAHIGFDFPHTPVLPPADYRERFAKHKYKVPDFDESELENTPKQLQNAFKRQQSSNMTQKEKETMIQDYYAFCAYGDRLVGQAADDFIAYSEKHKQPWMIVYVCGDHGWKLNEHGSISKFTPWDWDSHNPIIVVSSDKSKYPAGKVVKDYTEFVDIAPTILGAGGADLKANKFDYLDGFDMADVVSGKSPFRDYVVGESHHNTGPRAYIRTKEYVFSMKTRPNTKRGVDMNWALNATYEQLDPSLYHTTVDPREINNVAFNEKYKKIAVTMKDKLMNIVLGDNRVEVDWQKKGGGTRIYRSNFAPGSHDYKLKMK